jgi:hypothetical protein
MHRGASAGSRHPELLASRVPSCERAVPQRVWAESSPAPVGHCPVVRPTRGGPVAAARPGDVALLSGVGQAHLPPGWLFRDFPKPPLARTAQNRGGLPSRFRSPPPSIVPPRGGPGPGARHRRGGADFCRRGAVTALPPETALLVSKEKE